MNSLFNLAILAIDSFLGQTASQARVLVQLPNPNSSILAIIALAIYVTIFLLIWFIFGFFGIFTGTLGFDMAAGGIFVAGFIISYFVMLFIVGPYTMILQSRASGLLYNLH